MVSQYLSGSSTILSVVIPLNHSQILKCPFSVIEAHAPNSRREEVMFSSSGSHALGNNTVEYQRGAERQTLRCYGPLSADFTIKVGIENRTVHLSASGTKKQQKLLARDMAFSMDRYFLLCWSFQPYLYEKSTLGTP